MLTPYHTRLLAGITLAVSLPGIACFGWYSMDAVSNAGALVRTAVVVAYPAALLFLTCLVLALASARRSRLQVWACAALLALALAIVVIARM